jgi:hypothetical protein
MEFFYPCDPPIRFASSRAEERLSASMPFFLQENLMSQISPLNPFRRGFCNLVAIRRLCIARAEDNRLLWRRPHPRQEHLSDDWFDDSPCIFGDDFALVTDQDIPDDLKAEFPATGLACGVVYTIIGDDDGKQPILIGNVHTAQDAERVVRRLRFDAGIHSRCWEINVAHLTKKAKRFLTRLADNDLSGILFVPFRIPHGPAVGVKLLSTPWTDKNLTSVNGISAEELREQHRAFGVPNALVDMLHLAAVAEARVLIFDGRAPVLDGLPVFGES